jgi:ubiquinone/menaquinone biosynthesis C-methylase UbiE
LELDFILDRIGPGNGLRILDVGCGDGILAVELSRRGRDVMGVDASEAMVAAATARAVAEDPRVQFERAGADALPFPDDTFDVVPAVTVLCFLYDAHSMIKEQQLLFLINYLQKTCEKLPSPAPAISFSRQIK